MRWRSCPRRTDVVLASLGCATIRRPATKRRWILAGFWQCAIAADTEPEGESLQEELRALYVGVTRARERLWLTACRQRSRGDRLEPREPSRWLRALLP